MNKIFSFKLMRINLIIKLVLLLNILSVSFPVFTQSEEKILNNEPTIEYLNKEIKDDYIIGSGDVLYIKVSPVLPELNNSYPVDGNGTIIMPNLKRIYVSGLTINELTKILNKKYKTFIKNPSISIFIAKYRPIRVFVNGEVETPGVHTLLGSINLSKQGLGFENFNNKESTQKQITSELSPPESGFDYLRFQTQKSNNLEESLNNQLNNFKTDDYLLNKISPKLNFFPTIFDDGDVITIKKSSLPITGQLSSAVLSNLNPKYIKIFITGRVNNPGSYAVAKRSTLNDSISIAGGTKVLKGPVTFIRFNQDGTLDKRKFSIRKNSKRGSYKNPFLKSGDLIFVGRSNINIASEVIFEVTKPFIGIRSFYTLFFD